MTIHGAHMASENVCHALPPNQRLGGVLKSKDGLQWSKQCAASL